MHNVHFQRVIHIVHFQQKEHQKHVRKILAKLKEAALYAKAEKCEFNMEKPTFLGFIIPADSIEMDPDKIQTIFDWETPNSVKDVQCFLGFANFYRRFIHKYSNLCQPLFNFLRKPKKQEKSTKNTLFVWSPDCENVFSQLKRAFTSAPILRHFNPDLEMILECDVSDYVVSGVLSQKYPHHDPDTGKTQFILHPVAYMSEKMTPAKCDYGIGDKELLAIITALEKWYIYLY